MTKLSLILVLFLSGISQAQLPWSADNPLAKHTQLTFDDSAISGSSVTGSAFGMDWVDGGWNDNSPNVDGAFLFFIDNNPNYQSTQLYVSYEYEGSKPFSISLDPLGVVNPFDYGAIFKKSDQLRTVVVVPDRITSITFDWINGYSGDVNFDNLVNILDVNRIASNWSGHGIGDANADGVVNIFDVNMVSGNWKASSIAVPEPSTFRILLFGLAILLLAIAAVFFKEHP